VKGVIHKGVNLQLPLKSPQLLLKIGRKIFTAQRVFIPIIYLYTIYMFIPIIYLYTYIFIPVIYLDIHMSVHKSSCLEKQHYFRFCLLLINARDCYRSLIANQGYSPRRSSRGCQVVFQAASRIFAWLWKNSLSTLTRLICVLAPVASFRGQELLGFFAVPRTARADH